MTPAPGKDPVLFGKVPTWCGHVRPLVTYQTELQPSKSGHDAKAPLRPVPGYARLQKPRRLRMELRRGGDCNFLDGESGCVASIFTGAAQTGPYICSMRPLRAECT